MATVSGVLTRWGDWWREEFPISSLGRALPTAFLCYFLTVIFSVSLAALIFRGPLEPYLSVGIGMSLFSALATGLVVTFIGTVPGSIAICSDRTAPLLAVFASGMVAAFTQHPNAGDLLATCMAGLIFSTFLTGVALALLGHYRLGRLIRFLPFPVVGGFMAGAGWLLVKGSLTVIWGREPTFAGVWHLFEPALLWRWIPAVGLAVVLLLAMQRWHHFATVPVLVLGAVALFYLVTGFYSFSLPELRATGWLPGPFPDAITWHPVNFDAIQSANWNVIAQNTDTLGAVLLVSAISLLMISSALELTVQGDVDADRELETAGIANLVAACGGGLVGMHSLSLSSLSLKLGPRSRWVGVLTAGGVGMTLYAGPFVVSYLPLPVIGGLLCYLGLNFLWEWLVDSWGRVPRSEYLIIVLILFVIAWMGYIPGVGIGLVMAVVLFALRYSLIEVVRLEMSGARHRSNVDRPECERDLLRERREAIHILKLQGFIFFGTAHGLLHRVRSRVHAASQLPLGYLIVDFRHVTGLDSSALQSFAKLKRMARQLNFRVLCCSVPPRIAQALRREPEILEGECPLLLQPDVDRAVEWCETEILAPHQEQLKRDQIPFAKVVENLLQGRSEIAARLMTYFERRPVPAATVLAVQGERTRDLFLIEEGQVSAQFKVGHGETIRLRTLGAGSIVGEIGMYLNTPRTASLIADQDSVIWRLSPDFLARMEKEDPRVVAALHEALARIVTLRLIQANELLETALR
jgi:sulfate permease, SulP family